MLKSKWLATIVRDAPIEYNFAPFVISESQMEAAIALMENLEFRTHVRRAPAVLGRYLVGASQETKEEEAAEVVDEQIEVKAHAVSTYEELEAWVGDSDYALFPVGAVLRTNLFDDEERRAVIAVGDRASEVPEKLALQLLRSRPEGAILHDSKALYRSIGGMSVAPGFDTFLAAYVLRSERSHYSLRDLVSGYLEVQPPSTHDQMAVALYRLMGTLRDRLDKESQSAVLDDIELPLVPILSGMENLGIKAERSQLREFSKELEIAIEHTTKRVFELAECEFTIGSPKQLGEVLFDKMKLPGAEKTKIGYATGVEILSKLAAEHEIATEVLNWRELSKLKSTYADSLEKLVQADSRIHTTYNQAGAATGRLSSNDPNLQNIPIRSELGRGIRKAFVADAGYSLASLDYSQIELRILAHLCGEPALVEAFQTGVDVHTATARLMFGLGEAAPSRTQRGHAKTLNFAILYGSTEFGLAQQLGGGFSVAEAKELIKAYNERFPTVRDFMSSVVQEAKSKGFTTTLSGRRRYFPDIHAPRLNDRKSEERKAMNAPIQGTAADMMKLAIIRAKGALAGSESRLMLTVHDELVFELRDGERELLTPLKEAMSAALPLKVPVLVEGKIGPNWNDMVPV
jgi:DNA polymerase-1